MHSVSHILVGLSVAAVIGAAPLAAVAQGSTDDDRFDRDCMDDYGRQLCDPLQWAEIVASFDLEPAETVQSEGWRGVRVFTVDGYSHDMPMIAVLAQRFDDLNEPIDPVLEIRARVSDGAGGRSVITRSRASWWQLFSYVEDIQNLVRASPERQSDVRGLPVEELTEDPDEVSVVICVHAWVTVTESLTDDGVQRRARNACGDDPLFNATYDLSGQALRGFPDCNHIDPAQVRNESMQLQVCFGLRGSNRIAAAEVMNILVGDVRTNDVALLDYMTPETLLLWADGTTIVGQTQARAFLEPHFTAGLHVYAGEITGEDDEVAAEGFIQQRVDGATDEAEANMVWRRSGARWVLQSISVSPFERFED